MGREAGVPIGRVVMTKPLAQPETTDRLREFSRGAADSDHQLGQ